MSRVQIPPRCQKRHGMLNLTANPKTPKWSARAASRSCHRAGRVVVPDLFIRPAHDGVKDVAPGCHTYNFKEAGGVCLIHESSAAPCARTSSAPGSDRRDVPVSLGAQPADGAGEVFHRRGALALRPARAGRSSPAARPGIRSSRALTPAPQLIRSGHRASVPVASSCRVSASRAANSRSA